MRKAGTGIPNARPKGAKFEIAAGRGFTRRRFLAGSVGLGAAAGLASCTSSAAESWLPTSRVLPSSSCAAPPGFPAHIPVYQQAYRNWAGDIRVDDVWTCVPSQGADVVALANWARQSGYRLRARGRMHGWCPLTVTPGTTCQTPVILVDTTERLTALQLVSASSEGAGPAIVRAQTGVLMERLLSFLEAAGLGLTAAPAPGDLTLGGALAIDAHGTAVPASGETCKPGHTYGSLSNLILSITAVVWDQDSGQYVLRTFDRSHPHCKAFLTHLGRAFLIEVMLRVGPDYKLRCQSIIDIPISELLASPGSSCRTIQRYVESAGRFEVIWFPFTTHPWLKIFSLAPLRPLTSRPVYSPYNYPFSDLVPQPVSSLANRVTTGEPWLAPALGQAEYDATAAGLLASASFDLWGASKNLLLYIRPTTLRVTANGYAVLCRRQDIQRVLSEFATFYTGLLARYQAAGRYPINGPVEIRATGLDVPEDVDLPGAEAPVLSAVRPRSDHPEWDVAVWLDVLTFPGTPDANPFYRELESWIFSNYVSYAAVRPEWSKGWAYSNSAAWSDETFLSTTVREVYRAGGGAGWDWATAILDAYDPHHLFGNSFLDKLFA